MKQDTDGEPRPLLRKNENVGSPVFRTFFLVRWHYGWGRPVCFWYFKKWIFAVDVCRLKRNHVVREFSFQRGVSLPQPLICAPGRLNFVPMLWRAWRCGQIGEQGKRAFEDFDVKRRLKLNR